jgi:ABC-type spermidine/putrescine transport system permease subunit II
MPEGATRPGLFSKCVMAAVAAFLILPLLVVIPISFGRSSLMEFPPSEYSLRWYRTLWENPRWLDAAATSLRLGLIVAVLSTVLATLAAIGISRYRGPGKAAVQAVVLSPLVVPVIVSGVALYYLFSIFKLTGTLTALVLAHTLLTFPYGVIVINAALEHFDVRLEQAAMSLGAGPVRTLTRVTLPIIRPAIVVAALFAFLISFDEVVMALLLSGPQTLTLPKQMWDGIRFDLSPTIAAVSTVLLFLSSALVAVAEVLRRRSAGRGNGASRNGV